MNKRRSLRTSPPARVPRVHQVFIATVLLTNLTLPSPQDVDPAGVVAGGVGEVGVVGRVGPQAPQPNLQWPHVWVELGGTIVLKSEASAPEAQNQPRLM